MKRTHMLLGATLAAGTVGLVGTSPRLVIVDEVTTPAEPAPPPKPDREALFGTTSADEERLRQAEQKRRQKAERQAKGMRS